jgi:hypothetical protein
MRSKFSLRITSFYLFFFATNQLVSSNKIVDLIHSIRNKNTDENRSKDNLGIASFLLYLHLLFVYSVSEFRDIIQTIQDHLYNTSIPG